MSNGLYPDQNRRSVGTELGPNYLQIVSADKEKVGHNKKAAKYKKMKDVKLITRWRKIYEQYLT